MNGEQAVKDQPATPAVVPALAMRRGETLRVLSLFWDVDRLNADLDAHPEDVGVARTEQLRKGMLDDADIDEAVLDTLEHPERPVILLGIDVNGRTLKLVADGNHRLTRALREGQETILAYYVSPEREGEFRI